MLSNLMLTGLIAFHVAGPLSPTVKVERAITKEVVTKLDPAYNIYAVPVWDSNSPPDVVVMFRSLYQTDVMCQGPADGCHSFDTNAMGQPTRIWIVVDKAEDKTDLTETLSHEVLETIVDPYLNHYIDGKLAEVCDPLESYARGYYDSQGVWLSRFVKPSYF